MATKKKSRIREGKDRETGKRKLSFYPLNLEDVLRATIATGPIPVADRKPKPKKKAR